jgi:hypothetical protein
MNSREVFIRDWKAQRRRRLSDLWFSRIMEAICVAACVVMLALSW